MTDRPVADSRRARQTSRNTRMTAGGGVTRHDTGGRRRYRARSWCSREEPPGCPAGRIAQAEQADRLRLTPGPPGKYARGRSGEVSSAPLNEAVRAGLGQLEEHADVRHEIRHTQPLQLGRRLAGSIDNISEALAVAEGEDFR